MRSKRVHGLVLAASLTMLVWSRPACGQAAAATPPAKVAAAANSPAVTVLRVYDVGDLLLVVKNYPLSGPLLPPPRIHEPVAAGIPGGGNPFEGQGADAAAQSHQSTPIDYLKRLITDSIDTSSWKDNGGNVGSISVLNGQLFITQTAENQAAIGNVLDELRKGRAHMVRVRADWVLLPPGQIDKLLKKGGADTTALPEVSRDLLQKLPENTVHYTGQIACFSGQMVHIASGRARDVITAVTPVVASGSVAMSPTVDYVHYGVSLELSATIATDSATLDLASIVSEDNAAVPPPSTQPALPTIDRLNNVIQRFHTTVQVPLNEPVLVGGTTADPTAEQPAGKELYLIIEADTGK